MNYKILLIVVLIILLICLIINNSKAKESDINGLTDEWIKQVTVNHDAEAVYKLFCSDARLLGTVSQTKRKGIEIKKYFEYFVNLPNIKVISKSYNIEKIANGIYMNNAFITWKWDTINEPIVARMTFIYKNNCIILLHSSVLPEYNATLKKV